VAATVTTSPATGGARAAGALYLVIIACALFAEVAVRGGLVVAGDAAATAANLQQGASLWRAGLAADLVAFLADAAVAVLLYRLLRPVSPSLALAAAAFRLVGTAVYAANLLNHAAALAVVTGSDAAGGIPPAQADLALFYTDLHAQGYDLGLVFFGLHCLVLGRMLAAAPGALRGIGGLMAAGGVVYLAGSFVALLAPARAGVLEPAYAVPLAAELALSLWLLLKATVPQPAAATA